MVPSTISVANLTSSSRFFDIDKREKIYNNWLHVSQIIKIKNTIRYLAFTFYRLILALRRHAPRAFVPRSIDCTLERLHSCSCRQSPDRRVALPFRDRRKETSVHGDSWDVDRPLVAYLRHGVSQDKHNGHRMADSSYEKGLTELSKMKVSAASRFVRAGGSPFLGDTLTTNLPRVWKIAGLFRLAHFRYWFQYARERARRVPFSIVIFACNFLFPFAAFMNLSFYNLQSLNCSNNFA